MSGIHLSSEFLQQYGKVLPADITIAKEGESGTTMFIIASGKVRIFINTSVGEKDVATLGPGEFFGEMALMGVQEKRAASVKTVVETRVLELNRSAFEAVIKRSPDIAVSVIKALTERIRDANGKITSLIHKNDTKRLCSYLNFLAVEKGEPAPKNNPGNCFIFKSESIASALSLEKSFIDEFLASAKKARMLGQNGDWMWVPYAQYLVPFGEYLQNK